MLNSSVDATGIGGEVSVEISTITTASNPVTHQSVAVNPRYAYKNPATPGPMIAPTCQKELCHVVAFVNTARGIRNADHAFEAGL
jgi:hypothetical protein